MAQLRIGWWCVNERAALDVTDQQVHRGALLVQEVVELGKHQSAPELCANELRPRSARSRAAMSSRWSLSASKMIVVVRGEPRLDIHRFPIYVGSVKTVSLHVSEQAYDELKSIAARQNRSVAGVIREAMDAYLAHEQRKGRSVLDLEPFHCGPLREPWTRSDVFEEMLER